jgi:hypothetical protein
MCNILVVLDEMGCDWPTRFIAGQGASLHCIDENGIWDDEVLKGQPADVSINGLPLAISPDVVSINARRSNLVGFSTTRMPGVQVHIFDPDTNGPHEISIGGLFMRGYYDPPCA